MHAIPKTAIVGAGVEYDCFESSDRIGGNWAFRNPNGHSSAYRSLHIDTSRNFLSFNDFPLSDDLPDFPHRTQIKSYLDDYADMFGLRQRIHFETPVLKVRRLDGGGWELRTGDGQTRWYDALVVANGHHWDPRTAVFPGELTGESTHAHAYIDPTEPLALRGKRIVVVGIGNSAADLVSDLSQKSWQNTVYLSTRSGAWIVPEYISGKTADSRALAHVLIAMNQRALERHTRSGADRLAADELHRTLVHVWQATLRKTP